MRYGHQPISEIERLPVSRLLEYAEGLLDMVRHENEFTTPGDK